MTGPRSPIYQRRRDVEDLLALIDRARMHRRTITRQARRGEAAAYIPIRIEAAEMDRTLDTMHQIVQSAWCQIQAMIDAEG